MKLTIQDRILINNILPKGGSFIDLTIIKSIQENFSFSEKEIEEYKIVETFVPETNSIKIKWDISKDKPKEIFISVLGLNFIADILKELERKKILLMEYFYLYKSFVKEEIKIEEK